MSFKALGYNFYKRPIKFTVYTSLYLSQSHLLTARIEILCKGVSFLFLVACHWHWRSVFIHNSTKFVAPAGFAAYPYVREWMGLDNSRPDFPPRNYPRNPSPPSFHQKLTSHSSQSSTSTTARIRRPASRPTGTSMVPDSPATTYPQGS